MGTRSLTRVFDGGEQLVCMYRQMDGYPSCLGAELFDFLDGRNIINGISANTPEKASNGSGCMAASLIAAFKVGIGSVYLYPLTTKDAGQEYEYHIRVNDAFNITVDVIDGYYNSNHKKTTRGLSVADFGAFCTKDADK